MSVPTPLRDPDENTARAVQRQSPGLQGGRRSGLAPVRRRSRASAAGNTETPATDTYIRCANTSAASTASQHYVDVTDFSTSGGANPPEAVADASVYGYGDTAPGILINATGVYGVHILVDNASASTMGTADQMRVVTDGTWDSQDVAQAAAVYGSTPSGGASSSGSTMFLNAGEVLVFQRWNATTGPLSMAVQVVVRLIVPA